MSIIKRIILPLVVAAFFLAGCGYLYNDLPDAPKSVDVLYESGAVPGNIVLTPAADMKTMASVTWRTSDAVGDGIVQYAAVKNGQPGKDREQPAARKTLNSGELKTDKVTHCFSATLTDLTPGTTYRYRVGSNTARAWSDYRTFSTEPDAPESFTFVYLGDTQKSPGKVGKMLSAVDQRYPETAFYMIGGDLVNAGESRNKWDALLANTEAVFSRKPLAPAMGNHDFTDNGTGEDIFTAYFTLPNVARVRGSSPLNYSFQYGNAYFIVVNYPEDALEEQTAWLAAELAKSRVEKSAFKIVMFHYPVYDPKKGRENKKAKKYWVPLFDKYKVDLVLSGHDHSYMRSKPLVNGRAVPGGRFGTTYVVATGCEKFYSRKKLDIAAKQLEKTVTSQIITLETGPEGRHLLRYKACDPEGKVVDEFEMLKN